MFGCCLTDTCVTLGWWLQEQTQRPWQSLQPCLSPPKILVLNWLNPNPNLPGDCPATDQLYSSPTSLQESQIIKLYLQHTGWSTKGIAEGWAQTGFPQPSSPHLHLERCQPLAQLVWGGVWGVHVSKKMGASCSWEDLTQQ